MRSVNCGERVASEEKEKESNALKGKRLIEKVRLALQVLFSADTKAYPPNYPPLCHNFTLVKPD
jgi:hypothetical protein